MTYRIDPEKPNERSLYFGLHDARRQRVNNQYYIFV